MHAIFTPVRVLAVVLLGGLGFSMTTANAATLYWYPNAAPNQGGSGAWNTSTSVWSTTDGAIKTAPVAAPGTSDTAVFGGTGGNVQLNLEPHGVDVFRVTVGGYVFQAQSTTTVKTISVNSFDISSGIPFANRPVFESLRTTGTTNYNFEVRGNNITSLPANIRDGSTGGTVLLNKTGTGLLDVTGATLQYTSTSRISQGTLRVLAPASGTGTLPSARIELTNVAADSGILEIAGGGSFSRTYSTGIRVGSSAASTLAGFSARDGNATVNIDRASGVLGWDLTTNAANTLRSSTFQLGASTGNGTVTFITNLAINADGLSLRSDNGAAAIDGDFAAVFTRGASISNNAILNRTGDGVLRLSGNSTAFNMRFNAIAGTTLIDGSLSSDTANATYGIQVAAGAILGGDGTITLSNAATAINVSGTLMGGRGDANQSLTISSNLNLLSNSVLAFGLGATATDRDQLIRPVGSTTWSFQSNQRVTLWDAGYDGSVSSYALITGLAADPTVSGWTLYESDPGILGSFRYDAGTVYFDVIPEPSTALLVLLGLGAVFLRRRLA